MFSRVVSVDLEILNVKISDYWDFDIFVLISKTDIDIDSLLRNNLWKNLILESNSSKKK